MQHGHVVTRRCDSIVTRQRSPDVSTLTNLPIGSVPLSIASTTCRIDHCNFLRRRLQRSKRGFLTDRRLTSMDSSETRSDASSRWTLACTLCSASCTRPCVCVSLRLSDVADNVELGCRLAIRSCAITSKRRHHSASSVYTLQRRVKVPNGRISFKPRSQSTIRCFGSPPGFIRIRSDEFTARCCPNN